MRRYSQAPIAVSHDGCLWHECDLWAAPTNVRTHRSRHRCGGNSHRLSKKIPVWIDGATVFEIGSVGKVFTALLLAVMVVDGELSLADPVVKYLRAGTKLPERNGRAITLLDLATKGLL